MICHSSYLILLPDNQCKDKGSFNETFHSTCSSLNCSLLLNEFNNLSGQNRLAFINFSLLQ